MRKSVRKISTLLIVLGLLCVLIGLIIAASGLAQLAPDQPRFFRAGLIYGLVGATCFAAQFLFFKLPGILQDRRSETARRRRENSMNFVRPSSLRRRPQDPSEGSVLIFVLVVLGIVSIFSLRAVVGSRADHQKAEVDMQHELLKLAAIDGLRHAMQKLADDEDLSIDHPGESWAEKMETTDPSGLSRVVSVADAQRVFDLNNLAAPSLGGAIPASEVLATIMVMAGSMRPGLQVEALRDAMDQDDEGPFENTHYKDKPTPSSIPNRPLYGMGEVFSVDGWTPEMFVRSNVKTPGNPFNNDLVDCVGLIPAPRPQAIPVNIYTADAAVLKGMFGPGNEGVVQRLMFLRGGTLRSDIDFLSDLLGADVFMRMAPYLAVRSSWFEISSAAYNRDGRSAHLHAIAYRSEDGKVDLVKAVF